MGIALSFHFFFGSFEETLFMNKVLFLVCNSWKAVLVILISLYSFPDSIGFVCFCEKLKKRYLLCLWTVLNFIFIFDKIIQFQFHMFLNGTTKTLFVLSASFCYQTIMQFE